MAIITLRRADTCRDCGAELPVGSRARYYGPGKIYGTTCHEDSRQRLAENEMEPLYRDQDARHGHRDPGEDQADRFNEQQR